MKVHVAGYEPNRIGGGWTASRYLHEGLGGVGYDEAEIVLISGATMVDRSLVDRAKQEGKKIVLRVDNHLLNSRNRNSGMTKMKDFVDKSDLVIYQSNWAKEYLMPFTKKDGKVILNGVDTDLFYHTDQQNNHCVYIRSSRINEKGWEMARHWYTVNSLKQDLGMLTIVGKFSRDNIENNFDFYNNEQFRFVGEQPRENVADILRHSKYFMYSYFMDCCSNTLLEARASGCEIVDIYGMLDTGGAKEIMELEDLSIGRMINQYKEALLELL